MLKRFLQSKAIWLIISVGLVALSIAGNLLYKVDASRCIGCRICEQVCPVQAIEMVNGKAIIDPEKCTGCGLCVEQCPTGAISLQQNATGEKALDTTKTKPSPKTEIKRTESTSTTEGKKITVPKKAATPKTTSKTISSKPQQKKTEKAVDTIQHGITTTLPGTLKVAEDTSSVLKAVVDSSACNGCKICISRCPVGAIEIINGKAVIDPDKCIGCGMCVSSCPVGAIKLIKSKR